MSYLVLARKYRPRNFAEMVGQGHVVQALVNALQRQRLHHAYLFTGTRGVGKTTVARILAKSLNCQGADGQGGITAEPCGVCPACQAIDAGRFVDYTELDAASNRGVDEVQQLLEQAVYKPVQGRFKVFMIDEVHMLTNHAFNAMLKTLEEPPEYLKFVLATTDPQKVPVTVLSRCLQFNLRPMAPDTVREHLQQVLARENVPADAASLHLLARAARGSMRDALSLTDQAIAFGAGRIELPVIRQMLGSADRGHVLRLIEASALGQGRVLVETVDLLREHGLNAASTLEDMVTLLQRMAVAQSGAGPDLSDPDPEAAEVARLAALMPADETQLLYSLCLHGRAELGLAPDEYSALTMVLLRLLAFKPATAGTGVEKKSLKPAPEAAGVPSMPGPAGESIVSRGEVPENDKNSPIPGAERSSVATKIVSIPVREQPRPGPRTALAGLGAPEAGADDAPRAETPSRSMPFTDDAGDLWQATVRTLMDRDAISALVRELALQSQLVGRDGDRWVLRVERESLNQASTRERLQAALHAAGHPVSLTVEIGQVSDSPARRLAMELARRQRAAQELIQADPFVQEMMREFGAKIVPGSIKAGPDRS